MLRTLCGRPRARGATIGANPKLVFSLYFQQVGRLIENRRDFGILHGHRSPHPLELNKNGYARRDRPSLIQIMR
jgi:hypothetical protein